MLLRGSPLAADRFGPDIDEAESRWDALCSVRPEYFDGGLLAVGGGVTRTGTVGSPRPLLHVRIGGTPFRMMLSTWASDLWG